MTVPRASFNALYLKGGPTHFEKKLEKAVAQLMGASSPFPVKDLPTPAMAIKTRRTSDQVNTEWQNQKQYKENTEVRYNKAWKLDTTMFAKITKRERKGTQDEIID